MHDSPLHRLFPERWHKPGLAAEYQEWFFHGPGIKPSIGEAPLEELLAWMEAAGVTRLFCGHMHEQFVRRLGQRLICNAGAVGFCLDGDPLVSWVLVGGEFATGAVTIRSVAYDIAKALKRIDENDYQTLEDPARRRAYQKMFRTGIHWRAHLK